MGELRDSLTGERQGAVCRPGAGSKSLGVVPLSGLHAEVVRCHMSPASIYGCAQECACRAHKCRRLRMWFALRDGRVYGVELAGPLQEWTTNPHCLPLYRSRYLDARRVVYSAPGKMSRLAAG